MTPPELRRSFYLLLTAVAVGIAGAEPPPEHRPPETGRRHTSAGGLTSIWETVHRGARDMGVKRSLKTLLALNQKDGFDCPSCAWPDPDDDRNRGAEPHPTAAGHHPTVLNDNTIHIYNFLLYNPEAPVQNRQRSSASTWGLAQVGMSSG